MNRWLARGGQAYAAGVRTHKVRVAVAAMVAYDAAPHPQHGEKPALMVQTLAKRLLARIKSDAGAGAEGAESLLERLQPLGDVRQANAELLSKVAALEAELKALKAPAPRVVQEVAAQMTVIQARAGENKGAYSTTIRSGVENAGGSDDTHTLYIVELYQAGEPLAQVCRRFSEFVALRKQLLQLRQGSTVELMHFPSKATGFKKKTSAKVVEERQADLSRWLSAVVGVSMSVPEMGRVVLQWFSMSAKDKALAPPAPRESALERIEVRGYA